MKTELIKSINKMIVNGNRLELPTDDHFDNYAQVKRCLIDAGGTYKKCGFEFKESAENIKNRLIAGEAINDKKQYQFFATPEKLAKRSAGQGAIANIISEKAYECVVVELMLENTMALERQGYDVLKSCFLSLTPNDIGMFDKIVANPPFTKNQDIDHIKHMYSMLNPGGRLVSVASKSWTFSNQKKQVAFRDWLNSVEATVQEIPGGEFKESGTNISSVIVVVDRAA